MWEPIRKRMFTSYIHCTRRDHLRRSIPHTKRVLVFYPRGVGCITVLDNTLEIIMNTEINKHKKIAQSDEVHISKTLFPNWTHLQRYKTYDDCGTKKNKKKNKHGQISTIYLGNINPTQNIYLELHLLGGNCSYSPQISLLKCSTVFSNRPTMLLMIE